MNNIVLSAIVPVYNAGNYLNECIDNILSQSFKEFELILIDDGSIDKSSLICDEYAVRDPRVVVVHKQNEGVSSARNYGIELAKGRWITFIDADDYIEDDFFNVDFNSPADMLIQKKYVIGYPFMEEVYPAAYYEGDLLKSFLSENLANEMLRVPWGKFFNTAIIKRSKLMFDVRYALGEDALFLLDYLAECKSIQCVSSAYYMYRLQGSFIHKYKMNFNECVNYIKDIVNKYHQLGVCSQNYLSLNFTFYTGLIISHKKKSERHLWFRNKHISSLYKECYSVLPLKTKLKYFLCKYF